MLRCFEQCPHIDFLYQELNNFHTTTFPTIYFHVYNVITRCTMHVPQPLEDKKQYRLCSDYLEDVSSSNLYSRKELIIMESYISKFHQNYYIPVILVSWFLAHGAVSSHSNLYHLATLLYLGCYRTPIQSFPWNGEGGVLNGDREVFRRPTGSPGPGGTGGLRSRGATTKTLFC